MRTYIIKRLLWMIPTLLIITIVTYAMMRIAPGNPIKSNNMLSSGDGMQGATGELKAGESESSKALKKYYNLDKPWIVAYWIWLKGVLHGDFGVSMTVSRGTPVSKLVFERLPVTIKLNLWSMALIYLIAIPAGILASIWHNGWFDRISSVIFFMLYSLPSFWVGLLLIMLISKYFPSWPTQGLASSLPATSSYWEILYDTAKHYVLPVVCLSYGSFAGLSRFTRVGMLEVIRQDYIRTARAKGLSEWTVIMKHALRNAVIPLVTIFAGLLPGLIGGSIIIEFLFGIPGMGSLSLDALGGKDYPLLMTLFGFSAALTLVGILFSDIAYSLVDPRIRLD